MTTVYWRNWQPRFDLAHGCHLGCHVHWRMMSDHSMRLGCLVQPVKSLRMMNPVSATAIPSGAIVSTR
jgi:hypothetical protein